jgi:hypothetical protein
VPLIGELKWHFTPETMSQWNNYKQLWSLLKDHRKVAETEPEWAEDTKGMTPKEFEELSGCGCEDCKRAGELLGSI